MKRHSIAAGLVAVAMLVAACGDDDDSSASPTDAPSSETGDGAATGSGASAVVTLGADTFELTSEASCTFTGDDGILVEVSEGSDKVSLTSNGGVVLVRLTLGGVDWVDTGSPPAPDVSSAGASWTGEVSEFNGGGANQQATIDITC